MVETCLLVLLISTNKGAQAPEEAKWLSEVTQGLTSEDTKPIFASVTGSCDKNTEFQKLECKGMCLLRKCQCECTPSSSVRWSVPEYAVVSFSPLLIPANTNTKNPKSPYQVTFSKH